MNSLEKMALMNADNIEKKQMQEIFGGTANGPIIYLPTVTVTPDGNKTDSDDAPPPIVK